MLDVPRRPTRAGPSDGAGRRFMLYSHDGFGLGHFRRNLVLALTVTELEPSASVLLACSPDGLESFAVHAGVDVLRLPGLRKIDNGRYVSRRLHLEDGQVISLRSHILAAAVANFRPHVLLADKHPLGVKGELLPALRLQRDQGGRAALGLRDVLDEPNATRAEWTISVGREAAEHYQLALVYGSSDLLSPLDDGILPPELAHMARFCGYVVDPTTDGPLPDDMPRGAGRPLVLATAGGGEDGLPVLHAFVDASRGAGWRGVLVGGPQMEAIEWTRLRAAASESGVTAFRTVREVQRWYPHVDALVCMGGYNTLVEALAAGVPTVCVPRTHPRREQLIRARTFAERHLLELLEPEVLSGETLQRAICAALDTPRAALAERTRATLDLGGAQRAAEMLLELADQAEESLDEVREILIR